MSSSSLLDNILSGPIEGDVLWMQPEHVSEHVWNKEEDRKLLVRRAVPTHKGIREIPQAIVPYLHQSSFYGVARMQYVEVNASLISALVERWRPETHTFHMPFGECTITLQDVAVQLGLPVDGEPVIGPTKCDWGLLCEELLGVRPASLSGSTVKLSWLAENFGDVAHHMDSIEKLQCYARAYILRLIGGVLFVDKSSSKVSLRYLHCLRDLNETGHYAWGAAVLSVLYREMCVATNYKIKSIGGMALLIQFWAWERFNCIAPRMTPPIVKNAALGTRWIGSNNFLTVRDDLPSIRLKIDKMKRDSIVWEPYTDNVMQSLPKVCVQGMNVWKAIVPLVCFNVCEWHQPDRVMRQFGMQQPIPNHPCQPENLHDLTLRGKESDNWQQLLMPAIVIWGDRNKHQVEDTGQQVGLLGNNSEYMRWFKRKSKIYLTLSWAKVGLLGDIGENLWYMSSEEGQNTWTRTDLRKEAEKILAIAEEEDRVCESATSAPASAPQFEVGAFDIPSHRSEGHGLGRRRRTIDPETYVIPPISELQPGSTLP